MAQVYTTEGAVYLSKLLPTNEVVILEDCGHLMAIDKPEETANKILDFFHRHSDHGEAEIFTRL